MMHEITKFEAAFLAVVVTFSLALFGYVAGMHKESCRIAQSAAEVCK